MSRSAKQIFEDALSLDEKERARLAHELLISLDGPPDDRSVDEWNEVLARRSDEIKSGKAKAVAWDDVKKNARKVIAKQRRK